MWSRDQFLQTIAVTKLNYDQCSSIITWWSLFLLLFFLLQNNQLCAEVWFSTQDFSNSLTFPDNWWIIYIPWLSSDWKMFSDFPWLFQFSLTWTNPVVVSLIVRVALLERCWFHFLSIHSPFHGSEEKKINIIMINLLFPGTPLGRTAQAFRWLFSTYGPRGQYIHLP